MNKLLEIEEIIQVAEKHKSLGESICFTNGCFDILHAGHIKYLYQASELGDVLIIGLNSDTSVRRLKGSKRPINHELDRALTLSALYFVDYIIIFEEDTPYNLINHIKPNILVKGGDWSENEIVGADVVRSTGGKVVSLPYLQGYSTSEMIRKIREL